MTVTRLDHATFDWSTGAGGAEDVRRIAEAAAAHDGRESLNEAAVLTLRNHGLSTGILLVAADASGRPQGFAYVHGLYGGSRPELDLVVAPDARRRGHGAALAGAVLEAVDGIPVTAWAHGDHPGAAALARLSGFRAVRELWLMRRPTDVTPPAPPTLPPGYELRTFQPGADDRAFLAVNAAAFADHPEQGRLDQAGLSERMAEEWFDPDGFFVGTRNGELTGFHWTKVHRAAAGLPAYGEVYVIGVHPSAQGTGLGRALLAEGLAHLAGRGLGEVVLYVEASNVGAVRLYSAYGFTHAPSDTDVLYAPADG